MYKEIELRNVFRNGYSGPADTNVVFINGKRAKKEDIPRQHPFGLLVEKAQALGLPRMYQDDLYKHDRLAMYKYKPRRFMWYVRPTGTNLILFQKDKRILDAIEKEWFPGPEKDHHLFWYEARSRNQHGKEVFEEIEKEKARSFLYEKRLYKKDDYFDWAVIRRPRSDWQASVSSQVHIIEEGLFRYLAEYKANGYNAALKDWEKETMYYAAVKRSALVKKGLVPA